MSLLGFAPLPAPPHVFAMEPGRLRYACFGREAGRFRLQAYHAVDLPADAFLSGPLGGPLRDPAAFGVLVQLLLDRAPGPVNEASLVIPDAWLRVAFTESGELPRAAAARDEVLRWKLRRLVPFRVDELRVQGVEVEPLPGQQEPRRLLLGFAVEALLAQLEQVFGERGVRVGHLSNASLSLLGALLPDRPAEGAALTTLVLAEDGGYALVFARGAEPLLHRYKAWNQALPEAARVASVARDLRLTRTFLEEHLPGVPLGEVYAATRPEAQDAWLSALAEGLGRAAQLLRPESLPLAAGGLPPAWREAAPMLGAVCQEVR